VGLLDRRRLVWVGWAVVAVLLVGVLLQGGRALVDPSSRVQEDSYPPSPTEGTATLGDQPGSPGTTGAGPQESESQATLTNQPNPSAPTTLDPDSFPTIPECIAPRRLSVLTFNIHGGRTPHGLDLEAVAEDISRAKADVVMLQEVDRKLARTRFLDQPAILGRLLDMAVYYRANLRSNAILTRLPVTEWSSTRLPRQPGKAERRLVRAAVLVDGQLVHVFNTHLDHTSSPLRVSQMRAVRSLMSDYADQPAVLGGDFNATAGGATLQAIRPSMEDAWDSVGEGPGNTAPSSRPRVRIDYILHNTWLTARSARVLPTSSSDHRALRVGFDLWSSDGCPAGER
jgi:endonuclease/exonuclease/phosphatase family metal-dependent hydrolase